MYKKSIALFLAASSITSAVFAGSFSDQIMAKHHAAKPSVAKTHAMAVAGNPNAPYTDFSGTWTGDCGDSGPLEFSILNNAYSIKISGVEYDIGTGIKGKYEADEFNVSHEAASVEWNADGSVLAIKEISYNKANTEGSAAMEAHLSAFTLTMKNGQLNYDGKFVYIEDLGQDAQPENIHCVFTKKQ